MWFVIAYKPGTSVDMVEGQEPVVLPLTYQGVDLANYINMWQQKENGWGSELIEPISGWGIEVFPSYETALHACGMGSSVTSNVNAPENRKPSFPTTAR
ncbi:MAG: hypothetical protein FWD61_11735 [Phycisphaerales bacterium]|nr:hypothetical protein [Phycisphaerales bacterium]